MTTKNDSKAVNNPTTQALCEAWDHISAAIAVLKFARYGVGGLPPPACDAVALLLERANSTCSDLESKRPHLEVLGNPEFVHRITGAIDLAKFGSGNDLGDDNLNSGLPDLEAAQARGSLNGARAGASEAS